MPLATPAFIIPGGDTILFLWGDQGPSSKFSIVCSWTECLPPVKAGRPGGHLTPWVWGGVLGTVVGRECGGVLPDCRKESSGLGDWVAVLLQACLSVLPGVGESEQISY